MHDCRLRLRDYADARITIGASCAGRSVSARCLCSPSRRRRRPSSGAALPLDPARLALIEPLVEEAIAAGQIPGAVVVAGRGDQVLYRRAFGHRAVQPSPEAMTLDTIFDVASLTKVVATTTAVMALVEDGRIRLTDRVSAYVPGFERYGKDRITDPPPADARLGPAARTSTSACRSTAALPRRSGWRVEEVPVAPPGERFIYSDIGFFLLGHIVEVVSKQTLDGFLKARAFGPLGMPDTTFLPPASLQARIAPTEPCEPLAWPCKAPVAAMLRGVVHDPTARRMGGVAGHAGLFSTGDDLAIFARMLLAGGSWKGARVLSPLTVAEMMRPATPAGDAAGARPGLGHRHQLLGQPRRAVADRIVRPHGLHRHVDVDRSAHPHVRDLPVQPRASRRQGRCDAAARARRQRRGLGDPRRRRSAAGGADRHRLRRRARRRAARAAAGAGSDRHRRAARRGVRAAEGPAHRPGDQPHRPRRRRHADHRSARRAAGPHARLAVQPRARHSRHRRRGRPVVEGREDRAWSSTRSTARRGGPPTRCCRASTRSSSICRTSASASTPTARRWRT